MRNTAVVIWGMVVIFMFGMAGYFSCSDDDDDDVHPTATATPGEQTPTPTATPTSTPTSTPTPEQELGILNVWTTPVSGDIYVEGHWMGWGEWQGELPIGFYTVSFGGVTGYSTPADVFAEVYCNETTHVEGIYTTTTNHAGDLYSIDPIVGSMRYVPGGTFTQGSPADEPCRSSDETRFNHTLTRNIAVMETEITRQMWADLRAVQPTLPADPTDTSYGSGMTNPAQNMSWYETVLFANLLSVQNGLTRCYYKDAAMTDPVTGSNYTSGTFYCNFTANGYRLLTEGEWEYAARAGTTTPFSCNETNYTSGNCWGCTAGTHPTLEQYAVYCANDNDRSEPVGSKLANPWNLKDMHGNVWEWCWDWKAPYPGDTTDYTGPVSGSDRVLRGGYWNYDARHCRSAYRGYVTPGSQYYIIGFRLVRSVN